MKWMLIPEASSWEVSGVKKRRRVKQLTEPRQSHVWQGIAWSYEFQMQH